MKRLIAYAVGVLLIGALPVMAGQADKAKSQDMGKSHTASGTVSAVTGSSLTVKSGKEEMTFNIDEKTEVTGTGASTKSEAMKAKGQKTTITDFVGMGDSVTVTYHDMSGEKLASRVRVTRKSIKK